MIRENSRWDNFEAQKFGLFAAVVVGFGPANNLRL